MAGAETYAYGQCTYFVARELGWVEGGWGNAGDWCANSARSGLAQSLIPTAGAVVIYAPGDGYSTFGHCGIVRQLGVGDQFLVEEMNYVAWNEVDRRWSNSFDLECFILAPGASPGQGAGPDFDPGAGGAPAGTEGPVGAWAYFFQYINQRATDQDLWLDSMVRIIGSIG